MPYYSPFWWGKNFYHRGVHCTRTSILLSIYWFSNFEASQFQGFLQNLKSSNFKTFTFSNTLIFDCNPIQISWTNCRYLLIYNVTNLKLAQFNDRFSFSLVTGDFFEPQRSERTVFTPGRSKRWRKIHCKFRSNDKHDINQTQIFI